MYVHVDLYPIPHAILESSYEIIYYFKAKVPVHLICYVYESVVVDVITGQ